MSNDPVGLLRRHFGYAGFRPGQEELVRAVLSGRDALGVLPTGGGKSVCYQVPALAMEGVALVVTPLVSLMEDQVGRAHDVGLNAAHLSSVQSPAERRSVLKRARARALDALFVAPERLEVPTFQRFVASLRVCLLAVDEAHCISEWGHDFRPAYRRIGALRPMLRCPTLALTATATPAVRDDVIVSLALERPFVTVRSFDRPNLAWRVLPGGTLGDRVRRTYRLLRARGGSTIVYAPTRRTVETVRDLLSGRGVIAQAYHAGLGGTERSRVQAEFMDDACRVVCATNAFGMGIDKPDVRTVVHTHLPGTLESYYQEAGRAGRDGAPAECVAFYARSDRRLAQAFIDRTHPTTRALRRAYARLQRAADATGVVRLDDAGLRKVLGPGVEEWLAGEPSGVLGGLERVGAVRRIAGTRPLDRTVATPGGSVSDRVGVRRLLDVRAAGRLRRRARDKLHAVRRFARGRGCRRRSLLGYFGENAPDRCGRCDRCEDNSAYR